MGGSHKTLTVCKVAHVAKARRGATRSGPCASWRHQSCTAVDHPGVTMTWPGRVHDMVGALPDIDSTDLHELLPRLSRLSVHGLATVSSSKDRRSERRHKKHRTGLRRRRPKQLRYGRHDKGRYFAI